MSLEDKYQKEIVRDIARKKNLDTDVVRKAVYSQYSYAGHCMKDKLNYRIAFFGLFFYNQKKAERMDKYRKVKTDEE